MATKQGLKPQGLRSLLTVILLLVVLGGAGLFYYGLGVVKEFSTEVDNRLTDAQASETQVQQLQALRQQLTQSESLIAKADRLFVSAEGYQVQSLNDLNSYASQTGITITSTAFDDPSQGTYAVIVRLQNPVSYASLVQFITLIESNLPKMQVSSIDLTRIEGGGASSIEVGDIKINILVR